MNERETTGKLVGENVVSSGWVGEWAGTRERGGARQAHSRKMRRTSHTLREAVDTIEIPHSSSLRDCAGTPATACGPFAGLWTTDADVDGERVRSVSWLFGCSFVCSFVRPLV
eukprot:GHVU01082074.1.p1 GENE.GHVU01082074.1~~GHVU01082074.1.p1  ORF type:complete len:113 (+),score=2.86 GHVU01082074.1:102-440(+)